MGGIILIMPVGKTLYIQHALGHYPQPASGFEQPHPVRPFFGRAVKRLNRFRRRYNIVLVFLNSLRTEKGIITVHAETGFLKQVCEGRAGA